MSEQREPTYTEKLAAARARREEAKRNPKPAPEPVADTYEGRLAQARDRRMSAKTPAQLDAYVDGLPDDKLEAIGVGRAPQGEQLADFEYEEGTPADFPGDSAIAPGARIEPTGEQPADAPSATES